MNLLIFFFFFFFSDPATTEIYTLSLHDALPIWTNPRGISPGPRCVHGARGLRHRIPSDGPDRKSTRLNSSHGWIPYAVFCLTKNKSVQHIVNLIVYVIKILYPIKKRRTT